MTYITIMYQIRKGLPADYNELLTIWEASVRVTHDFLDPDDILFFKNIIQQHNAFSLVDLTCIVDEHNKILGFMGIAEDKLEMLFLDPAKRGKGLGKQLMQHAFEVYHITKVDVNEQNESARQFYEHFGFKVQSRSPLDGTGKPYPILHMELT
jgi:putative acetyltransferase